MEHHANVIVNEGTLEEHKKNNLITKVDSHVVSFNITVDFYEIIDGNIETLNDLADSYITDVYLSDLDYTPIGTTGNSVVVHVTASYEEIPSYC